MNGLKIFDATRLHRFKSYIMPRFKLLSEFGIESTNLYLNRTPSVALSFANIRDNCYVDFETENRLRRIMSCVVSRRGVI